MIDPHDADALIGAVWLVVIARWLWRVFARPERPEPTQVTRKDEAQSGAPVIDLRQSGGRWRV
jgi:hypothetical protein